MTDKHDKLVEAAKAAGFIVGVSGTTPCVSIEDLAAFRDRIVASLCADVEPVGEVMLGYSTELEKCYPDGPMNHVHWNEKSAVPCAGSDIYSASTVAAITAQRDAAMAALRLNLESLEELERVGTISGHGRYMLAQTRAALTKGQP